MSTVAMMIQMKVVGVPTNPERRGYAPEVSRRETIARWIWVVVQRVAARVVVIYRIVLVSGYLGGFVVRHVDHLGVRRRDLDDAIVDDLNDLMLIAFEIAGHVRALPEFGYRDNHLFLLQQHRLCVQNRHVAPTFMAPAAVVRTGAS